jgi:hypothetical protein
MRAEEFEIARRRMVAVALPSTGRRLLTGVHLALPNSVRLLALLNTERPLALKARWLSLPNTGSLLVINMGSLRAISTGHRVPKNVGSALFIETNGAESSTREREAAPGYARATSLRRRASFADHRRICTPAPKWHGCCCPPIKGVLHEDDAGGWRLVTSAVPGYAQVELSKWTQVPKKVRTLVQYLISSMSSGHVA